MPVIFELKPNTRHAAKQRRGFLRFLASCVNNKFKCIYSTLKPRGVLAEVLAVKVSARPNKCSGFTLLELLVVIGLLGLVAMSITSLVVEDQGVKRQEVTEKRWDEIRKAIIGDASRTLNGEPMLSGYVADMGRLPANLKELMAQGDQPAWTSVALSSVTPNMTGELSGGWRGPYLYTGGSSFFRDGWVNVDPDAAEDNKNFGWVVGHSPVTVPACTIAANCTEIAVQSLGFDNATGGDNYDEDSPAVATLLNANGWQLNSSNVTFNIVFNKPPTLADQTNLKLMVYFFEDDATVNLPKDSIQPESSSAFSHVQASTTPHTEPVSISGPLPMGKLAVVVWCSDQSKVYDGNCSSATNNKQPYYYTLLPSTVPSITIPWNIIP